MHKVILFNFLRGFTMLDAQFFKSFRFNLYERKRSYARYVENCPYHYFRRIVSGSVRIVSGKTDLHLKKGDYFFLPKGLKFRAYWTPENGIVKFYSFGFSLIPLEAAPDLQLQKLNCTPEEIALFRELEESPQINPTSVGMLYRFLGAVLPKMAVFQKSKVDRQLDAALAFMQANHSYTIADVARHCGISECSLFLKFRKHLGKTPVEIRHQILSEEAVNLLISTDLSVEEISSRLGFSSSSYFRKILKKTNGQTPTQIRNLQRQFF